MTMLRAPWNDKGTSPNRGMSRSGTYERRERTFGQTGTWSELIVGHVLRNYFAVKLDGI